MQRCFTNILSANVDGTSAFYEKLFGLKRHFYSDWFVLLKHDELEGFEFGILQRDNRIVPDTVRNAPSGVIVTFVVNDCDAIHKKAVDLSIEIIETPTDMPYGQRRMLLNDPDGTVVDVSSHISF